jgi:hypothetical protein
MGSFLGVFKFFVLQFFNKKQRRSFLTGRLDISYSIYKPKGFGSKPYTYISGICPVRSLNGQSAPSSFDEGEGEEIEGLFSWSCFDTICAEPDTDTPFYILLLIIWDLENIKNSDFNALLALLVQLGIFTSYEAAWLGGCFRQWVNGLTLKVSYLRDNLYPIPTACLVWYYLLVRPRLLKGLDCKGIAELRALFNPVLFQNSNSL